MQSPILKSAEPDAPALSDQVVSEPLCRLCPKLKLRGVCGIQAASNLYPF